MRITRPDLEGSQSLPLPATGILLAGGTNSRMGRNKAFLEFAGKPLIERSLAVLSSVFEEVLISSNEPALYQAYGVRVVQDQVLGRGPLAGLVAGLGAARFDTAFFTACDMPFVQEGLIRYLWRSLPGYDIVVPRAGEGVHPLHAFYTKSCLAAMEENLRAGRHKIIAFYPSCRVRYVPIEELKVFGDAAKILANVNTPEEWAALMEN
ncbi:molybdenum cofactor guanylyltransferase [Peptococcaceae bacterium CEB3]|nr:molybdenum cofactor guanylyltransferase [Peptococcaceae bacterium CEB3]